MPQAMVVAMSRFVLEPDAVAAQVGHPNFARPTMSRISTGITLALFALLIVACSSGPSSLAGDPGAYEGTLLGAPAADFRLTDQDGARLTLSEFRGKVIVLTFMDSQCQDICPLTASHLRAAYRTLGDDARLVVLLGVNVNVAANTEADVAATTRRWRLNDIPTWHFLTGNSKELQPIWKAYNIAVAPNEGGEILHTPGVYLIDQTGQERWYVSTPFDSAGDSQGTAPLSELLVKHIRELLSER